MNGDERALTERSSKKRKTVNDDEARFDSSSETNVKPILSLLLSKPSRTEKYRQQDTKRKQYDDENTDDVMRKYDGDGDGRCFEVRQCPEKGGIGLFATRHIDCGDYIIAHEEPLVSYHHNQAQKRVLVPINQEQHRGIYHPHSKINTSLFCYTCATPLGTLREQLNVPNDINLPCGLDANVAGPCYSKCITPLDANDIPMIQSTVAWCSTNCQWQSKLQSFWLNTFMVSCSSREHKAINTTNLNKIDYLKYGPETYFENLEEFYESLKWIEDSKSDDDKCYSGVSPILFRLATNAMLLTISKLLVMEAVLFVLQTSRNNIPNQVNIDWCWWKEYGSHPLWWKMGCQLGETNGRKQPIQLCQEDTHINSVVQPSVPTTFSQRRKGIVEVYCNTFNRVLLQPSESESDKKDGIRDDRERVEHRYSELSRLVTEQVESIIASQSSVAECGTNDTKARQRIRQLRQVNQQKLESWLEFSIESVCVPNVVGEILGMLQCNVMEFEFPSPVQQYAEYAKQECEDDDGNDHHNQDEDSASPSTCNSQDDIAPVPSDSSSVNEETAPHALPKDEKMWMRWFLENIEFPEESHEDDGDKKEDDGGHEDDSRQSPIDSSNIKTCHPQKQKAAAFPVLGSGLYPLLTLANHDCDPNASIEFLQESNRGSMIAIRDISKGEEICITYVPNGDLDPGENRNDDGCDRFKNFKPSRTWIWLNRHNPDGDGDENEVESEAYARLDNQHETTAPSPGVDVIKYGDPIDVRLENYTNENGYESCGSACHSASDVGAVDEEQGQEEKSLVVEGQKREDRAKQLWECYNFVCSCHRCIRETSQNV